MQQSPNTQTWEELKVYRGAVGESAQKLLEARMLIKGHEADRWRGDLKMSLVYKYEVDKALRMSKQMGRLSVSVSEVYTGLTELWPDNLKKGLDAQVLGLNRYPDKRGYPHPFIAVDISYDTFQQDRTFILDKLNILLGIEHEWKIGASHITIAHGALNNLTNRDEIEARLPPVIGLSPAVPRYRYDEKNAK